MEEILQRGATDGCLSCKKGQESASRVTIYEDTRMKVLNVPTCIAVVSLVLAVCSVTYCVYLSSSMKELRTQCESLANADTEERTEDVKDPKDVLRLRLAEMSYMYKSKYRRKRNADAQPRLLLNALGANVYVPSPTRGSSSTNQLQVTAAHFVAKGMQDPQLVRQFQGDSANCIAQWGGNFCRNSTFWSASSNQVVQFLSVADWMMQHPQAVVPLRSDGKGRFSTMQDGLYLLYFNILVQATKIAHDVAVFVDDQRKLDCRASLDYIRPSSGGSPFRFARGKTCSASGVFYLNKDQNITVKLVTPNTLVVLRPETCNFGAVCLSV